MHTAKEKELDRINELRKQVNDLHVDGKPDVFKPGLNQITHPVHEAFIS